MRIGLRALSFALISFFFLVGLQPASALTSTSTAVSCIPTAVVVGTATSCTATVTGYTGSITGETVSFAQAGGTGSVASNACALSSGGTCTLSITASGVGNPNIQATYIGDSSNGASSGTSSITVSPTTTTARATCSPSPVSIGSKATCTTVIVNGYNPGGSVSWTTTGHGQFTPTNSCSVSFAQCSVAYTPSAVGDVQLTGAYGGDTNNIGSSSSFTLKVSQNQSSTSVACSPPTVVIGSLATCTATVKGYSPTGTVSWTNTGTGTFSSSLCTLPGTSTGTCQVTFTPQNSSKITATYAGDSNNLGSLGTFQVTAVVNQNIQFTVDNSGPPVAVTLSGCSVSPASIVANGMPQSVQATPGCSPIVATLPQSSGDTRYVGPGGVNSFTISTCTSGACQSFSATIYYQLQNTYQATPTKPSAWTLTGAVVVAGTVEGAGGTTVCTVQVVAGGGRSVCRGWSDYERQVSMADISVSTTQRWSAPQAAFTDNAGGNTHEADYYFQVREWFQYTLSDSSAAHPVPVLNYTSYGVSSSLALQSSATQLWLDATSGWTVPQLLAGSTSSERWATNSISGAATAGRNLTFQYYHQYLETLGYSMVGSTSGSTPPTATISIFGVETSFQFADQTTRSQAWADAARPYNFTNPLVGSTTTARWSARLASGIISSSTSLIQTYYYQYAFILSFSVIGGGEFRASQLNANAFGSNSVQSLNTSATDYWLDAGSSWSVSSQLAGSTSSERWITGERVSGTAVSPFTVDFSYHHQYLGSLSYQVLGGGSPSMPVFSYSLLGSNTSSDLSFSPAPFWIDSGTAWSVPNILGGSTSTERWIATSATEGIVTHAFTESLHYQHQYFLRVGSNTAVGGSISNSTQWYNSGVAVNLTGSANARWRFEYWKGVGSGSYNGTSARPSFSVNGPINETAMFYPSILIASSSGGSVHYSYGRVSGSVPGGTNSTLYVPLGQNVTLSTESSSVAQIFYSWSGNLTNSAKQTWIIARGPAIVTANFGPNYVGIGLVTVAIIPVAAIVGFIIIRRMRWW